MTECPLSERWVPASSTRSSYLLKPQERMVGGRALWDALLPGWMSYMGFSGGRAVQQPPVAVWSQNLNLKQDVLLGHFSPFLILTVGLFGDGIPSVTLIKNSVIF